MMVRNLYALSLSLLFFCSSLIGQNCYVQLDDASGYIASPIELANLETAACELIQAFPQEYQDSFNVYGFGFYLHQGLYQGGFPKVFQDKVTEVEQMSPYFLMFGWQLSISGEMGKIWVKVRLPQEGNFICYEADYLDRMEFKLQMAVSQALTTGSLARAEQKGIESLLGYITEMVECCDPGLRSSCSLCSWTYNDVIEYQSYMGFTTYNAEISPTSNGLDSLCLCSYDYQLNNDIHVLSTGEVRVSVSFSTLDFPGLGTLSSMDIFTFLTDLGEFYAAEGTSFYAVLTDQTIFCSSSGEYPDSPNPQDNIYNTYHKNIQASFEACNVGVWYNVLYTDNVATLAIKTKGIDIEKAWILLNDTENTAPFPCCSEPDEFENGIEILTLEAPASYPLNSLSWQVGGNATRGNTEDIASGYSADDSGILLAEKGNTGQPWSDDDLFGMMKRLFNVTTVCGNKSIAHRFIDEFRENDELGKVFWYHPLSVELAKHPTVKKYTKLFGKELGKKIAANDGILPQQDSIYINMDDNPINLRPQFNAQGNCSWADKIGYDRSHGFQIIINDTEETQIYIHPDSYSYDGVRFWAVKVTIIIYDHFGLDKNDALTYQSTGWRSDPINAGAGFAAWWRLQHRRGYKPFRTMIVLNAFIKGEYIDNP